MVYNVEIYYSQQIHFWLYQLKDGLNKKMLFYLSNLTFSTLLTHFRVEIFVLSIKTNFGV